VGLQRKRGKGWARATRRIGPRWTIGNDPQNDGEADEATLKSQLDHEAKKAVPDADPFDIEAAIYWFASDNYEGMSDPLYGVLSLSKFKPGPAHSSVEDEGETAAEIYNHLKSKFAKSEDTGSANLRSGARFVVKKHASFQAGDLVAVVSPDEWTGQPPEAGFIPLKVIKPGPSSDSKPGYMFSMRPSLLTPVRSQHEADEPNVHVRPMTIDPKTKRQANAYLSDVSKKYWPGVPLFDIAETMKEKFGIEVEEGLVTGEQGRDTFELSKGGMPIKNSVLALSWFKMPVSGKYEVTAYLSE
jgi:hypothetical protein